MFILGIETSCDETAAAVVCKDGRILSNIIYSQIQHHIPYGGVVPEIAARNHLHHLDLVIQNALTRAQLKWEEIKGIAATGGPGLVGGLIVGVMAAKALAASLQKPFIAINHLEGHALTARLTHTVPFPFIVLLISGGHCQFILAKDLGEYEILGQTRDDAVGESFDKVAQLLELDYPGGPSIERLAQKGNPNRFSLPTPLKGRSGCDLSFSGLKTAVRQLIQKENLEKEKDKADVAASFQKAIGDTLCERLSHCLETYGRGIPHLVLAGGVAANQYLRLRIEETVRAYQKILCIPPPELCTDNAAMIAWAGCEWLMKGRQSSLGFAPNPRWSLTESHL